MTRRRYSDDDRASAMAALAANGGKVSMTAAQLGIPVRTLQNWADGTTHPESAGLGRGKMKPLADTLEELAVKCVGRALEHYEELSPKDCIIVAGVAIDKFRLLREESTSIEESRTPATDRVKHYDRLLSGGGSGGDDRG